MKRRPVVFEVFEGMYQCRELPAYARFLLNNHLEDYALEQVLLSRKMKLPLLLSLESKYTDAQIAGLARESSGEYLTYLAENKAAEQIAHAMDKWLKDQLEVVGKLDIIARDITVINFIRGQVLKKFIRKYSQDIDLITLLHFEIDTILLGNVTSAVDIYMDILKSKIDEQSNLATKVIEASPAVTFVFDIISGKQVFVSGNVKEVMGFTSEEILAMGDRLFMELTHPDDFDMLLNHINQLITENPEEARHLEYRFRHKDGKYRWLRTYEMIFRRDMSGRPMEILGKTFEITGEKQTALALEKREQQLLEAQRIGQIGSYEWNIAENKSTNTQEVFRIFELQGDQRYEEFLSYVHPDDVQKVKDSIARSFDNGHYECEYRYIRNGKEKVIWSRGQVEFENQQPAKMMGTVQDVTEIKKLEKELVIKSHELAHSNESLRQFAYVASHDMKEPLRKIMMFSDMVNDAESGKLSVKSVAMLQKMQAAGRNLYRMIEDILSFSLLEAREEKNEVSLMQLIAEVTELLDETIQEKKARIVYNDLPEAHVISSQFRQLFQNLIANSLKFSKKDIPPIIHITAVLTSSPAVQPDIKSAKYLEIVLQDNGIGFPAEASEKIFELFNRYHSKSQYEGTGLGLAISRRIVENHDGIIKASPHPSGATFTISIPQ